MKFGLSRFPLLSAQKHKRLAKILYKTVDWQEINRREEISGLATVIGADEEKV